MTAKLVAQEGLLKGQAMALDPGPDQSVREWHVGRDPDMAGVVLQDPAVSRQHVLIRKAVDGYTIENLSATNPVLVNGKAITGTTALPEKALVKIGSSTFLFTEEELPALTISEESPVHDGGPYNTIFEAASEIQNPTVDLSLRQRWLIKVIGGPQSGAEFSMERGKSYVIGSDPTLCDVIFYDLSVSRKHAKITVQDSDVCLIEDLSSRNGVYVDGVKIDKPTELTGNEVVALGTTSFVVIDREKSSETILALSPEDKKEQAAAAPPEEPQWKKALGSREIQITLFVMALVALFAVFGISSLFQSEPATEVTPRDYNSEIAEVMKGYPDISWSYNSATSKLFLAGHVLTAVDKTKLEFALKNLHFISDADDANVIVDQNIWSQINTLIAQNPEWVGISMYADQPGHFILTGYLNTREQAAGLSDWINQNFSYLDRLENRVVVEQDLQVQIVNLLLSKGFNGVTIELGNGELTITGFISQDRAHAFQETLEQLQSIPGLRVVKNFVAVLTPAEAVVDISDRYHVTGFSTKDDANINVIINGQILSRGDTIDGMVITSIQPRTVFLEKNGLKFKIEYNP